MADYRVCSIPNCGKKVKTGGMCSAHAERVRVHGDPHFTLAPRDRVCSVPGCEKKHTANGFCLNHYRRNRDHGDPLAGITAQGEPIRYLVEEVLTYQGDDCLRWPFATWKGYGRISYEGRNQNACRVVCLLTHGEPPHRSYHAAHTCGKGHEGCVNPRHLVWKTPIDNKADELEHGVRPRGSKVGTSKLTEEDVLKIRMMKGSMSQRDIASKFAVSEGAISAIMSGAKWGWLTEPQG